MNPFIKEEAPPLELEVASSCPTTSELRMAILEVSLRPPLWDSGKPNPIVSGICM
jgi:hypothetical protein